MVNKMLSVILFCAMRATLPETLGIVNKKLIRYFPISINLVKTQNKIKIFI